MDLPFGELSSEAETYFRELPQWIRAGYQGRGVLIKGHTIHGFFENEVLAFEEGIKQFGLGVPFLAQPIDREDLRKLALYNARHPQTMLFAQSVSA